jgi:molybdenum cofactor synthesis domain-containing protein
VIIGHALSSFSRQGREKELLTKRREKKYKIKDLRMKILSVNVSEKKGTVKKPVESITLTGLGVEGDAHAGKWQRQVSLLGRESISKFEKEAGRKINFGEFAENITTEGLTLYETHPLDRFISGDTVLEITQIGKHCHGDSCAIYREVGNCVMPKEGIFCRVISPGTLKASDSLEYKPKIFRAHVITLSDRASEGVYEDRSGPRVREHLQKFFEEKGWMSEIAGDIIPDEAEPLKNILVNSLHSGTDLIFTTGGTGIGPRDITPEVVKSVIDFEIPGIMEMIRMKYGMDKPNALISRSIAGKAGGTLIYSLPGSVRAVDEYMTEITKGLKHTIYMLHGLDSH